MDNNNISLLDILNGILKKKTININKQIINTNFNQIITNKDNIYFIIFDFIYNRTDINYDNIINDMSNDINNNTFKINKQYIFNKNIDNKQVFKNVKTNNIKDNIIDYKILLYLCYYHNININIIKDNILYLYYIDEFYDKNKKEIIIKIDEKNYLIKNKIDDIICNYKNNKVNNIYNLIKMNNELKIINDKYLISPIIKKNKTIKYIDFCSIYKSEY